MGKKEDELSLVELISGLTKIVNGESIEKFKDFPTLPQLIFTINKEKVVAPMEWMYWRAYLETIARILHTINYKILRYKKDENDKKKYY